MSKTRHGYILKRYKSVFLCKRAVKIPKISFSDCRRYFAFFIFVCMVLLFSELSGSCENSLHVRVDSQTMSTQTAFEDAEGELEKIFDEFAKLLPPGIEADDENLADTVGIEAVLRWIESELSGGESGALRSFALFFGISLLFAVSELLCFECPELAASSKAAIGVCMTVPVLQNSWDMILTAKEGVVSGSELFSGALPLLCSVAAIGGGVKGAAASAAMMSVSLSFVSGFLAECLLPISTLIFAASLISSFDTGQVTKRVAKGIKNIFTFFIGAVTVVLLGTLTLQNVVATSQDTVALRGVKYAISGMVPIAGSTISGALSALVSGTKAMTSTMGALSVVSIISVMGAPLIRMLLYRLAVQLCITFSESVGAGFGQSFFESFRGAIDALIATLTSSTVIYVMQIVVFMKVTSGAL